MGTTILLLLIPLAAWILIAKIKFGHEFTWAEMGIQGAVTAIVLAAVSFAGFDSQTSDTMLVNGVVTETNARRESCNQFWSDWPDSFCTNQDTRTVRDGETCTTDSKGNRTCTPRYKTQYRSVFPWEIRYFVFTDIDYSYEIDRVDAQGVRVPPRFETIEIADPVTVEVGYTNYIKGASATLFNQRYSEVPQINYPEVFDYYRVNRVIYTDVQVDPAFLEKWNEDLSEMNSRIRQTGANVIINVVNGEQDWAERLAQAWDAHNINDIVVSIGATPENTIRWVDVRSWSSNEMVDIVIRDSIMELGTIDSTQINEVIKTAVTDHYEMQSMSDFEYLSDDISTPTWVYILAGIILLIVTPATTIYLSRNDVNDHKMPFNRYNRY